MLGPSCRPILDITIIPAIWYFTLNSNIVKSKTVQSEPILSFVGVLLDLFLSMRVHFVMNLENDDWMGRENKLHIFKLQNVA